jgi:hypothetical protein
VNEPLVTLCVTALNLRASSSGWPADRILASRQSGCKYEVPAERVSARTTVSPKSIHLFCLAHLGDEHTGALFEHGVMVAVTVLAASVVDISVGISARSLLEVGLEKRKNSSYLLKYAP